MGTKDDPAAFDCYAAAVPDEPMFILLARDGQAPALVEAWADMREANGENAAKVAEARQCAAAMRAWRARHRADRPVPWDPVMLPAAPKDLQASGYDVRSLRVQRTALTATRSLATWQPPPPAGAGWRLHMKLFDKTRGEGVAIWVRLRPITLAAANDRSGA